MPTAPCGVVWRRFSPPTVPSDVGPRQFCSHSLRRLSGDNSPSASPLRHLSGDDFLPAAPSSVYLETTLLRSPLRRLSGDNSPPAAPSRVCLKTIFLQHSLWRRSRDDLLRRLLPRLSEDDRPLPPSFIRRLLLRPRTRRRSSGNSPPAAPSGFCVETHSPPAVAFVCPGTIVFRPPIRPLVTIIVRPPIRPLVTSISRPPIQCSSGYLLLVRSLRVGLETTLRRPSLQCLSRSLPRPGRFLPCQSSTPVSGADRRAAPAVRTSRITLRGRCWR